MRYTYTPHHFKKNKRKETVLSILLAFLLTFYQVFLPLGMSSVLAEDSASGAASDSSQEESIQEEKSEEKTEEENDEEESDEKENSQDTEKEDADEEEDDAEEEISDEEKSEENQKAPAENSAELNEESANNKESTDSSDQSAPTIEETEKNNTTDQTATDSSANQSTTDTPTDTTSASEEPASEKNNSPETFSSQKDEESVQDQSDNSSDAKTVEEKIADPKSADVTGDPQIMPLECQYVNPEETAHILEGTERFTTALNENCAIIENVADSTSSTGTNTVNQGTDPGSIATGDANIATGDTQNVGNVYNEANTNTFGTNNELMVTNIDGYYDGDINLLEYFSEITANADQTPETQIITEVVNNNEVIANNDLDIAADSGNNSIANGDPTIPEEIVTEEPRSGIDTGDAVGIANLLNFFNTNIVGDNWLMAMVNIFGEWVGDLIVPGEGLMSVGPSPAYSDVIVDNNNNADLNNNMFTTANTGENTVLASSSGIETGLAGTSNEVKNIANTNIIKNNWFLLMVNNMGSWAGQVLNWNETTGTYDNLYSYDFGSTNPLGLSSEESSRLIVANNNYATVNNNVSVDANSGRNDISAASGAADIKTGDALALAKILNFVNTNIVGSNWLFGVVNVFGQWTGDVVFAYPDLEVSISDNLDNVTSGENVTYHISYKNKGEASASGVELQIELPEETDIIGHSGSLSRNGHSFSWSTDELQSGEDGSFTINATVNSSKKSTLESAVGIVTSTKEIFLDNNADSDTTSVENSNSPEHPIITTTTIDKNDEDTTDSQLSIARKSSIDESLRAGGKVTHLILVANTGTDSLEDVKVQDKLYNSDGVTMSDYSWNLGKMKSGDILVVKYEVKLSEKAPAGHYNYSAQAEGKDKDGREIKSKHTKLNFNLLGAQVVQANFVRGEETFNSNIIPTVEAAEDSPVLTINGSSLPVWILISALIAYLLTLNWSLHPGRPKNYALTFETEKTWQQLGLDRLFFIPAIATLAALALWWLWSIGENLWYPASIFAILILSYANLLISLQKIKKKELV